MTRSIEKSKIFSPLFSLKMVFEQNFFFIFEHGCIGSTRISLTLLWWFLHAHNALSNKVSRKSLKPRITSFPNYCRLITAIRFLSWTKIGHLFFRIRTDISALLHQTMRLQRNWHLHIPPNRRRPTLCPRLRHSSNPQAVPINIQQILIGTRTRLVRAGHPRRRGQIVQLLRGGRHLRRRGQTRRRRGRCRGGRGHKFRHDVAGRQSRRHLDRRRHFMLLIFVVSPSEPHSDHHGLVAGKWLLEKCGLGGTVRLRQCGQVFAAASARIEPTNAFLFLKWLFGGQSHSGVGDTELAHEGGRDGEEERLVGDHDAGELAEFGDEAELFGGVGGVAALMGGRGWSDRGEETVGRWTGWGGGIDAAFRVEEVGRDDHGDIGGGHAVGALAVNHLAEGAQQGLRKVTRKPSIQDFV